MFILNQAIDSNSINIIKTFFETANMDPNVFTGLFSGLAVGMGLIFIIFLIALIILGIITYIYYAITWSTIARKLNYEKHWLAWIPIANFFLRPILADYNWKYGFFILTPFVLIMVPVIGMILSMISCVGLLAFEIVCCWKIYKKRGHASELALIKIGFIIPFLTILTSIAELVVIGIVAWVDNNKKKIKKPIKIRKKIKK